ncbi:MAG: translation initiation factor [Bacteroidota bacterium]
MKKKTNSSGIIYSTDPDFKPFAESSESINTALPSEQKLLVRMETKHRGGKVVTLVEGFLGNQTDREELTKKLKNHCGTGGSAKDGEILVQGDHREKLLQWLIKNGFIHSKKR